MVYLVSQNRKLFSPEKYQEIDFDKAMEILNPLKLVQFDTETMGLDCHTKALLTVQLGNKENQVVFDWTTLRGEEKKILKEYFESDRVFLGWNLMFDLTFMYVQDIWPKHLWDGMLAEILIYLGCPPVLSPEVYDKIKIPGYAPVYATDNPNLLKYYELSYSLKAAAKRRCNVDLDKSVRGEIINKGLTEEVIEYAANDVVWLEDIKNAQEIELNKQDLMFALEFECEFIKSLAYFKYCGVHLDVVKWTTKIANDLARLRKAEKALNDWVSDWDSKRSPEPGFEFRYISRWYDNSNCQNEDEAALIKDGYMRCPQYDTPTSIAYKKRQRSAFTEQPQRSLFDGMDGFDEYDDRPKCIINWSSSKQVVALFELLGINVKTFDKKTKREKKSVEEKLLAPQADQFPIIKLYLEYQGAAKVVSTYGENWKKAVNEKTRRIHVDFHSIGTDTGRVSSGGGVYKLNLQNLPHDAETRSCFTAEPGNVWISADYSGQESAITASVSNDLKMVEILSSGGDLHSEVAKSCWPDLLGNLTVDEIKHQYKSYRQNAKGVEFGIFYGGDANTLRANKGFEIKEAERIYNSFMAAFPGIKRYQDYCRKEVMAKGYILMNPITKHRAHIFDYADLLRTMEKFNDPEFWSYYREMKRDAPTCDTVQDVRKFFKRKSESERQSINYRIQNRGACCFKLASIKFFNWIVQNNYQNIVKMCVPVHDEFNVECPEEMAEEVGRVLVKCMIAGGKPFCPNVFLGADLSRHSICTKGYVFNGEVIMEPGDTIAIIEEKVLHNLQTDKKYVIKDLPEDHKDCLDENGPFPKYWVH